MSNFELSQAMEKETIPLYLNLSAFNHFDRIMSKRFKSSAKYIMAVLKMCMWRISKDIAYGVDTFIYHKRDLATWLY